MRRRRGESWFLGVGAGLGRGLLIAGSALLLAGPVSAPFARSDERPALSHEEARSVLSHGPWPAPWQPDPGNRVSGNRLAAALGQALFTDERMSRFGALSCAGCHKEARGWGDGRAKASSVARLDRNTPSLYNVRYFRWFGWDGGADSLWMQSLRPVLDPRELASSPEHVQALLDADAALRQAYIAVFAIEPASQPADLVLANAAKALAAYQETIVTGRAPFDDFRDALASGDAKGMSGYPEAALRGLKLFVGKGACSNCHTGPLFTNGEFHDTGLAHFTGPASVDSGRHGGLEKLKVSRFNRLGIFSDDASGQSAWATRHVVQQHRDFGAFRVPSLRNVALTAPYMHDGSKPTLAAVVRHYSTLDEDRLHAHGERILRRLDLSDGEIADLVAFLESLSERR